MKVKRIISVFCALCLSISILSGCTGGKKKEVDQKDQTTVETKETSETKEIVETEELNFDKKFTYSYVTQNSGYDWDNDVRLNWFKQKFNIDFDFLFVTPNDWHQKVRLWIGSGDMPDVLWWDFKPADVGDFYNWARQGVFRELPVFDSKYPNIKEYMEKTEVDDKLAVDGKK